MRIVEHLRSQGVTVHSLLCAALLLAGRGRLAAWREHSVRLLSLIDLRPFAGLGIESTLAVGVGVLRAEPEDTSKICEMAARAISVAKYLAEIGAAISWLAADGIDAQRVEDFMMANFASEGMVSNLGVLQFALGFGNLTLRSFWTDHPYGGSRRTGHWRSESQWRSVFDPYQHDPIP